MFAFSPVVNNIKHLLAFRSLCQVFITLSSDKNIILNPHAAHMHVLI